MGNDAVAFIFFAFLCYVLFFPDPDESETTSSNAGDYWASDYGDDGGYDDGGFGE